MAKRGRGRRLESDVLRAVAAAREASKAAIQELRREIAATRKQLELLSEEERSFRLDLFGTRTPGRPPKREAARIKRKRTQTQKTTKSKSSAKKAPTADKFFGKLPSKFTINDVRKLAGKATAISLAQWTRGKRIKKTGNGYEKVA